MADIDVVVGTLQTLVRQTNSPSGNPRWGMKVDGQLYLTENDCHSASYGPDTDHVGRRVQLTISRDSLGNGKLMVRGYSLADEEEER